MYHSPLRTLLTRNFKKQPIWTHVHNHCTGVELSPNVIPTDFRYFPKALVNIMLERLNFLRSSDRSDGFYFFGDEADNCVILDANGTVNPNVEGKRDAHNGATYLNSEDMDELAFNLSGHMEYCEEMKRDAQDSYVCTIRKGTPIPADLKLWNTDHYENPHYLLRAKVPLSLPNLQVLLSEFQEAHGKTMKFHGFILCFDSGILSKRVQELCTSNSTLVRSVDTGQCGSATVKGGSTCEPYCHEDVYTAKGAARVTPK